MGDEFHANSGFLSNGGFLEQHFSTSGCVGPSAANFATNQKFTIYDIRIGILLCLSVSINTLVDYG